MSVVYYGPYGSTHGSTKWNMVVERGNAIKEVVLVHDAASVNAIGFVLARASGTSPTTTSHLFGGNCGRYSKILLKNKEYLTQISGMYEPYYNRSYRKDNYHIVALRIHTNLTPDGYGPFGSNRHGGPNCFSFQIHVPSPIDGAIHFFGRHDERVLLSIGLSIIMSVDKYGPYGSIGPPDWNVVLDEGELIKEITVHRGSSLIENIEFVIADKYGRTRIAEVRKYVGLIKDKIILKPNEYVTQISGTHGSYVDLYRHSIGTLNIHTNLCPQGYGPYVSHRSDGLHTYNFSTPVLRDCDSIVEIYGISGRYIESIGVRVKEGSKPVEQKEESKEDEREVNEEEEIEGNGRDSDEEDIECKGQESQEENREECSHENRGSIAFFTTYRPPVALDIYTTPSQPNSSDDEVLMTDGNSYNYNGRVIPRSALKIMLERPMLAPHATEADIDSGRVSGLIFVSERTNNLETLHVALLFRDAPPKVFNFAEIYGTFQGVRMEDSGCIAGDYLVYVSTMEPHSELHQPWTAVYKTNLKTGKTERLTLKGHADLSPSVSPNGKKIAVASFQRKAGWDGEVEDLKTSIFIMNVEQPLNRQLVAIDGGWPTWGSDDVIFFHRNVEKVELEKRWGVFRIDLRNAPKSETRVTPTEINAMTPAAIDETRVVVATLRRRFTFEEQNERQEDQYRHIEIFDNNQQCMEITRKIRPKADHFNPFVMGSRIGYHRCNTDKVNTYNVVEENFYKVQSPNPNIGVFRVSGVFPSISECGTKLAFVDNEFKAIWVADKTGLHNIFEKSESDSIFSPVWNRKKDILYVCVGRSFKEKESVRILAIIHPLDRKRIIRPLTKETYNSAFPSSNGDGTRIVFRSTKDGPKNLYIMDAVFGEFEGAKVTRLTEGEWIDTQCQWSPKEDWIVFSSNRSNPRAEKLKDLPDAGYFGIYLVKADDKDVVIKVIDSGFTYTGELFPGHVNHPQFSPDGKSLVVAADFAAVSCDPVSMPLFLHSVRPYGDLFILDVNCDDIYKNKNLNKFTRITHSRYENSTGTWTMASTKELHAKWNVQIIGDNDDENHQTPICPYICA